jgi:hypothetical protein
MVSHPNAIGSRRIAPKPHLLHEQPEHRRRELAGEHERLAGQPWREVVERVAGGEHDPSHACGASDMSSWMSAPPMSLPTRGMQIEAVKEFCKEPSYPGQRQVSVGVHRVTMRAKRQRRCHASVIDGQISDRSVPQRGVHH